MSNLCNSLNIKTLKISQLRDHDTINPNDIFLVIESADDALYSRKTTFSNIADSLKKVKTSYVGNLTGSFSGSVNGKLSGSFTGSGYGVFEGTFSGSSVITDHFEGTGSFYASNFKGTGSFFGIDYVKNFKNTGIDVSFNGTASYAVSSSYAKYAKIATALAPNLPSPGSGGYEPVPIGVVNQFPYWDTANTLGTTDYLSRSPSDINAIQTNASQDDPPVVDFGDGRIVLKKPLYFNKNNARHLIGENIIFKADTGQSVHTIGMQENTLYLRADSNFVIYHSGSFESNKPIGTGTPSNKNRYLSPGKNGYTVFSSCQRLVGMGWFGKSTDINAQCHIHLSGSKGYRDNYNAKINAFLITSGSIDSTNNKLLRVSGSGQLDVKGDVIAMSTFASSDERLKTDVSLIDNSIELIEKLNPVQFKWIINNNHDYGLIAQEVEKNYPELIKDDINGYKTVKYNSFIPILIQSIKDLKKQVEQLQEKINQIENNS